MKPPFRTAAFLLLLAFLLPLPACLPRTAAEEEPPAQPRPPPIHAVTAGRGVPVSVSFEDPAELAEVRLYFKTMTAEHYLFLPMTETARGTFSATLPPARNWTKGIDYLLLRRSTGEDVRKSKPFRLLVMNDFSTPPAAGEVQVLTERVSAGEENKDFAVPLRIAVTPEPLLARAVEDPYPPIAMPDPGGGSSGIFGGLGGVSFSLRIGGVSFRYRSFSGR